MRIGLSGTVLSPTYNQGRPDGMSVCTRQLLQGMENLGHQVSTWSFADDAVAYGATRFPAPFHRLLLSATLRGGRPVFSPDVDLFHVTDYRSVPMSCPVVTTLYDAIPMVFPEMANPRFRRLKNHVLRRAAGYADHVIAISAFSTTELIEHYRVPASKISIVPCGVDAIWLERLPGDFIAKVMTDRRIEPGYFLFVGILQPRKNLERVIAAHDMLTPDMRKQRPLVVVGKSGWRCEKLLVALQRKIELGEARWFNDVRMHEELRALYAAAGVFLFPSLYEGFGLPVLEAFASGVPVVTSNATSLPEVSGGVGFEVQPESVIAIAEAMLAALTPSERAWRVPAGIERAQAMSWETCVQKTLAVYSRVLKGSAS